MLIKINIKKIKMENQQNGTNTNPPPSNNSLQLKDNNVKQTQKKIKKVVKTTSGKPKATKKVIKSAKVNSVKKVEEGNQILPAQTQRQILPSQTFQKELPIKNLEHVNQQYQLKDIINKTKTMINYNKALSTTVVKPVIVQEVITRKPIIAPVDYKTPINFFEGQPLSEEDLKIQNFFKDTSYMDQAKSQDIYNSYLFNGNNNNILAQSVQYQAQPVQYSNFNSLSQSVQYPTQRQNIAKVTNFTQNEQNYLRPQVQKVQPKTITDKKFKPQIDINSHNTNTNVKVVRNQPKTQVKKVTPVKTVAKSLIVTKKENTGKKQELSKSLRPIEKMENITVNNMLKATYPVLIEQKKIVEQSDEVGEDPEEKMPRDSIRIKK